MQPASIFLNIQLSNSRALLRAGVKNVYFIAICIGRGQ